MKWYNKEDYYNFKLEIWKSNILLKLKEAENKNNKTAIYFLITAVPFHSLRMP